MGHFQFKKSIKLTPLLKLNFNKNSTSVTLGHRGLHHTINSKGTQTTSLGVPGNGFSYVDIKSSKSTSNHSPTCREDNYLYNFQDMEPNYISQGKNFDNKEKNNHLRFYQKTWFMILMLIFVSPIGLFLMWYYKEWRVPVKVLISVFFVFYFMIYCALFFT